jgi:catalase
VDGVKGLSDEELKAKPDAFAFDELRKRVASGPVEFNFRLQLAEAGDNLNNATVPLPASRKTVTVGKLSIKQVEAGEGGACHNMTFNPTALPKGIEASTDPMLLARAAPYLISLGRRLGEAAAPRQ